MLSRVNQNRDRFLVDFGDAQKIGQFLFIKIDVWVIITTGVNFKPRTLCPHSSRKTKLLYKYIVSWF